MSTFFGNLITYANTTYQPMLKVDARAVSNDKIELVVDVWLSATGSGVRVRRTYFDYRGYEYSDEEANSYYTTVRGNVNIGRWVIPVTLTDKAQTVSFGAYFDIAYNVDRPDANQRSYIQVDDYTVPPRAKTSAEPLAPANLKAYRIKGANVLRWDNLSRPSAPYRFYAIYRKEVGTNQYLWVHSLRSTSIPQAYVDRSINEDKAYIYRIHTHTGTYQSKYLESNVVYTLNASPPEVKLKRNDDGSVTLSWDNPAAIADNFGIWRYTNGQKEHLDTVSADTNSYTDTNPPVENIKYSVNAFVQGVGANPTFTREIKPIQKPLAPSIEKLQTYILKPEPTTVSWIHHSVDGLPQLNAEVKIKSLTTLTEETIAVAGDADSTVVDFAEYEDQELEISARVQTSQGWSDYGVQNPILIKTPPIVTPITENNIEVSVLPFTFSATADDATNWKIDVVQGNRVLHTATGLGTNMTLTLDADSYVPLNNQSYDVKYTAYKSYEGYESIASSIVQSFSVAYTPPAEPIVTIERTEGFGALIKVNYQSGAVETRRVALYRLFDDGSTKLLQDFMSDGQTYEDAFAPLANNTYRAVAFAESGAAAILDITDPYSPKECVLNYGDNWEYFIRLAYNPTMPLDTSHVENSKYQPAAAINGGEALPLIFTSSAVEREVQWSGKLANEEDNKKALAAANFNGVFLWRDYLGRVCACAKTSNQGISVNFGTTGYLTNIDVNLTEVSDDRLD